MFSARLPVTYSRKRGRRKYVAETSTSLPSSPLRELSPSKHDVTLSEMSRRMKKRSRQVVGSQQLAEHDIDNRVAKKLKPPSELDLCSMAQRSPVPTVPSTPVHHSGLTLPLNTQQIYDSLFETPSRPSDEQLIKSYIEPDQLSPIPVARRMLSRTNSRNLKENIGSSRQCLASPFSSRPASRTSSPRQALKTNKGRPLHSKSRTLSSSFGRQQAKPVDTTQSATSHGHEDSIFDSIFSPTTHAPFTGISTHGRTGSIPSMPSNLLNHIPAQDWLVPAKALSRSPPSLEDMQLDDIATDHPSFYLDEPAQISTPPRKRRMTVTLRNFRPPAVENHQSDSVPMDLTDPVTAAEEDRIVTDTEEDGGPAHSRRRRRTVVHMSSDSIFSSALDFSAYMTEFSPTQKIHNGPQPPLPQVPPGLTAPCSDFLDPTLDSACAPTPLDPAFSPASNIALALDLAIVSGPNSPTVPGPVSHTIPPTPEVSRPCLSRRAKSLQNPTPSGKEELHKMFVTLGLYGTSDSGIHAPVLNIFFRRPRRGACGSRRFWRWSGKNCRGAPNLFEWTRRGADP